MRTSSMVSLNAVEPIGAQDPILSGVPPLAQSFLVFHRPLPFPSDGRCLSALILPECKGVETPANRCRLRPLATFAVEFEATRLNGGGVETTVLKSDQRHHCPICISMRFDVLGDSAIIAIRNRSGPPTADSASKKGDSQWPA